MKYPLNTTSKPVVGSQAKTLLKAIKKVNPLQTLLLESLLTV